MTSAGGEQGRGGGGGGTYCLRRRAWGALRRRGGTCSRAGLRRWCSSRGRCRGGRQTWRGTRRSGRGRGRRAQRCGRGGGTWRVRCGEMCITDKRRFSLFPIVPPDNPGLLFITAVTYCRLQSRRVDFTLTPAVVYHHTPGCPPHASAQC